MLPTEVAVVMTLSSSRRIYTTLLSLGVCRPPNGGMAARCHYALALVRNYHATPLGSLTGFTIHCAINQHLVPDRSLGTESSDEEKELVEDLESDDNPPVRLFAPFRTEFLNEEPDTTGPSSPDWSGPARGSASLLTENDAGVTLGQTTERQLCNPINVSEGTETVDWEITCRGPRAFGSNETTIRHTADPADTGGYSRDVPLPINHEEGMMGQATKCLPG